MDKQFPLYPELKEAGKEDEGAKMIERIIIIWKTMSKEGCEGILTLDRWQNHDVTSTPTESYQCKCSMGDGYMGFASIAGGVVSLTEEQINRAGDLIGAYWVVKTKEE